MRSIILRHRRENLKKCSLRGLEKREDLLFFTYPIDSLPDLSSYVLLQVGAPPLTEQDREKGIFLIDGTWRLAKVMERNLNQKVETRALPGNFVTAYPRKQTDCPDPERGLSSVEALFIAHLILGKKTEGLLDHYHWKKLFLSINASVLDKNLYSGASEAKQQRPDRRSP